MKTKTILFLLLITLAGLMTFLNYIPQEAITYTELSPIKLGYVYNG